MIVIVATIKRKPGLSLSEFRTYYVESHGPLGWRIMPPDVADAIVHNVQHHATPLGSKAFEPDYDCVTEIGFADRAGLKLWNDWYLGPDGAPLRDDEQNFMDVSRRAVVVTERVDVHPSGSHAV